MRWGEPTRLPPLRRGRGLTAAALLTVGLVAAYVVLGVLSLTSVAPSTLLKSLPSIGSDRAARGRCPPSRRTSGTSSRRQVAGEPGEPRHISSLSFGRGDRPGRRRPDRRDHEHVGRTARPRHPGARLDGALGARLRDRRTTARRAARPRVRPASRSRRSRCTPARWTARCRISHAGGEVVTTSGSLATRRRCRPGRSRPRRGPRSRARRPGPRRRQPASPDTRSTGGCPAVPGRRSTPLHPPAASSIRRPPTGRPSSTASARSPRASSRRF